MTTGAPATAKSTAKPSVPSRFNVRTLLREPLLGPLVALVVAIVIFSSIADSFLNPQNVSLILQQSVVVGILAVGQTLIILTSGIDLSIGAVAVFGTIVMAQSAGAGGPVVALGATLLVCVVFGAINGGLVTTLRLPPFIVTLGTFTAILAGTRLLAGSETYRVEAGPLTFLGTSFRIGSFSTTFGVVVMLLVYLVMWYALSQTSWGKHIYAVGGNPQASNLSGIKSGRVLFSVYLTTGVIAAIAAWAALGRIPNADPNAYQNANLETITAVVIGGTSLFGGRGGVGGTLVGTLIVGVLRNGLTQAGVDSLYQNIATGVLVIVAVAVDQFTRRRSQ
jgi:fructose transport system permease protein